MNINYDAMDKRDTFVPAHIRDAIRRYIEDRLQPGSFVTAVIRNDLREAVGRADHINLQFLRTIVRWFYSHAPAMCWGSQAAMENWLRPQGEAHD